MMNKKVFVSILAVLFLFSISGCQLAIENKGNTNGTDRLIGFFITEEYLDLFDAERFLNDNISKIKNLSGDMFIDAADSSKYQKRLYASVVTRTITNENGETAEIKEFDFEGVEGISYFVANVPDPECENSYITQGSDNAVSDAHISVVDNEEEDSTALECTIYIASESAGKIRYINPVYQSPDGNVYAVSGNSFVLGGLQGEGSTFSTTMDEKTTVTENGKSRVRSYSVKVTFTTMYPPVKISVLQMDKDSNIISRADYSPGEVPDAITPSEEVEYIIVESQKYDLEGQSVISRSVYDRKAEFLETFYCLDNDVCARQITRLEWIRD